MIPHTEANTGWLWKPFQVNTITCRTEANCNTNKMLTSALLSLSTVICLFLCRVRQMTVKSKLIFFSLKLWLFSLKPRLSTISELPKMCSFFEINTMLKLMLPDVNWITVGLLCYLHASCAKEPVLRIWPLSSNAAVTCVGFEYAE